jgi:hypothetical protein
MLLKSDKLSLFAHFRATFAPKFLVRKATQGPASMSAKEVQAYFQGIRNLGHFRPPWHNKCPFVRAQGWRIQEFFRLLVGANGGKAANGSGQVFEVS